MAASFQFFNKSALIILLEICMIFPDMIQFLSYLNLYFIWQLHSLFTLLKVFALSCGWRIISSWIAFYIQLFFISLHLSLNIIYCHIFHHFTSPVNFFYFSVADNNHLHKSHLLGFAINLRNWNLTEVGWIIKSKASRRWQCRPRRDFLLKVRLESLLTL